MGYKELILAPWFFRIKSPNRKQTRKEGELRGRGPQRQQGLEGKPGQIFPPRSLFSSALLPSLPPTAHPPNPRRKKKNLPVQ